MRIRHNDVVIPDNNPFENCKLNRKLYAEILTSIIGSYTDGFVLAINNEWGTGKTTFVKMLRQHLKNQKYSTLYFNAWENDSESNPLTAIMSELQSLINKNSKAYKSLLEKGAVIAQHLLPAVVKGVAKKYIDTEVVTDALENLTKSATEIFKTEIIEYTKRKNGLQEFRIELVEFLKTESNGKPLVFIIDELDRCRPNYSVEILEHIKHFFNVPGIVFILSIDKTQLGNAVRGVYGSERINADEYLRRFIDLEYSIPKPQTRQFCQYLYEYFEFDSFFLSNDRTRYRELLDDKEEFLKMSTYLFESSNTTLRQQEKIFSHARVALNSFNSNHYVFPTMYLSLIYIREFNSGLYLKIKGFQLSPQEFINEIRYLFPKEINTHNFRFYLLLEANMVIAYYNSYSKINSSSKIKERDTQSGKDNYLIQSAIASGVGEDRFFDILDSIYRTGVYDFEIINLLNKIDLTTNFTN